MATLNFPDSPTIGDIFAASSQGGIFENSTQTWTWNGAYWEANSTELVVGPTGPTGPAGAKGDQGISIVFKGSVASVVELPGSPSVNDAYVNDEDGNLYVWSGSDWTDAGQIVGPQGEAGVTGPTGPTGPQGDTGAGGQPGQIGPTGPTGATGANGVDGQIGPTGAQGEVGPTGAAGIDGSNGVDGQSATVSVGTVSTVSYNNSASVVNSGTALEAVLDFEIPRGATGPTGPTGASGTSGTNGVDGASFTLLASYTTEEFNLAVLANEAGTAYIVDGHLYFWNTVSETYDDLGSILGPTGPQGPQGTDIHFAGSVPTVADLPSGASNNDAYIVDEDGNLWVSNGAESWTDAGQIVGPQGPTGAQGATGPAGVYTASNNNISITSNTIGLSTTIEVANLIAWNQTTSDQVTAARYTGVYDSSFTTFDGTAANSVLVDGHKVYVQNTFPTTGMSDGDILFKRP